VPEKPPRRHPKKCRPLLLLQLEQLLLLPLLLSLLSLLSLLLLSLLSLLSLLLQKLRPFLQRLTELAYMIRHRLYHRLTHKQQETMPSKKRHPLSQFLSFSAPKHSQACLRVSSSACQKRPFQ
jgi:hypothetical protein